jgi:hypothetical protein
MSGKLLFERLGETKLTSLKFSNARDGFDKQIDDEPLIVKSLPSDPYDKTKYIGIAPKEKEAALENKERASRFFSTPRGKEFIQKQIGLQLSNTKLESVELFGFDLLGARITPNSIVSLVNISRDIANNGINENNALSAISALTRKSTREGLSPLQTYNPQNTLDQIGSDPNTGWNHYDRFGVGNIVQDSSKYWYIVNKNNNSISDVRSESPNNRLVILQKSLGVGLESEKSVNKLAETLTKGLKTAYDFVNVSSTFLNQGLGIANALGIQNNNKLREVTGGLNEGFSYITNKLALADRFAAPFTKNIIDQYEGGPGSLNGIGPTVIKRYDNTNNRLRLSNILEAANDSIFKKRNLFWGDPLSKRTFPTPISKRYQDQTGEDLFTTFENKGEIKLNVYKKIHYESIRKTNLPLPKKSVGKITIDKTNKKYTYSFEVHEPNEYAVLKDKLAKNNQYFGETGKFTAYNRSAPLSDSVERVVFTPIDPFTGKPLFAKDAKGNLDLNTGRIFFDAFISNFKDTYSPTWNDINYIGRSESFHVFTKFKRDISFTLQVPCFNPKQLRNRHRALSELASQTAGRYSGGKLGGVITYLRLGKYLAPGVSTPWGTGTYGLTGEPGIITSLNISIPNDASWDIDEQLAHYLTVDIGFNLIHNSRPEWNNGGWLADIGGYIPDDFTPSYDATNLNASSSAYQKANDLSTNSGTTPSLLNSRPLLPLPIQAPSLPTLVPIQSSPSLPPAVEAGDGEYILDDDGIFNYLNA